MDVITTLILDPAAWAALLTLVVMEVVLGVDNLVFISILTNKLPEAQRPRARAIGMFGALALRVALLGSVFIIVSLKQPVIALFGHGFSWRDLILLAGGLFLLYKATSEIIESTDGKAHDKGDKKPQKAIGGLASAIVQILLLDLVFSVDSILTAVGMTDHLPIMIVAVLIAVALMFAASGPIAAFIHKHPSVVMLALGFLLMIGVMLIMEGFGQHVDKGYIYAAMAFAGLVEVLQMLRRKAAKD